MNGGREGGGGRMRRRKGERKGERKGGRKGRDGRKDIPTLVNQCPYNLGIIVIR